MRTRSAVIAAAATAVVACAGTLTLAQPGHAAPAGYRYKCCVGTEAPCLYTGQTNSTSKSVSLSGSAFCRTGSAALNKLGFVRLRNGKRSVVRTVRVRRSGSSDTRAVKVSLTVRLRVGKSLSGAVTFTTKAKDCATQNGRVQRFSMRYAGPL